MEFNDVLQLSLSKEGQMDGSVIQLRMRMRPVVSLYFLASNANEVTRAIRWHTLVKVKTLAGSYPWIHFVPQTSNVAS